MAKHTSRLTARTVLISLTPAFSIHTYCPSPPVGLLKFILCQYSKDQYKFLMVDKHWHIHLLESREKPHL